MVFLVLPRKKFVFGGRTNFFLGKRWFWTKKPTFSEEKDGFGPKNQLFPRKNPKNKKNIFWETIWPNSKKMVFWFSIGKSWFLPQNYLFPRKELVFWSRTIFFSWKKLVFCLKPFFVWEKLVLHYFYPCTCFLFVRV